LIFEWLKLPNIDIEKREEKNSNLADHLLKPSEVQKTGLVSFGQQYIFTRKNGREEKKPLTLHVVVHVISGEKPEPPLVNRLGGRRVENQAKYAG
jgi:hypothetical protein